MARKTKLAPEAVAPTPEPAERIDRPLTEAEKLTAFRTATRSLPRWYADEIAAGMTDEQLTAALKRALGIFGGCTAPGELDVTFQGSGLCIWASWAIQTHIGRRPLFAGAFTVATAREVYGIGNPQDRQMRLF